MLVHYGEGEFSPTAERPFPFNVRELARLEVQRSQLNELRLAYRRGMNHFRSTMGANAGLLPTSEPGLDSGNGCYSCSLEKQWGSPFEDHLESCPKSKSGLDYQPQPVTLSDEAAGMLGRLDNHPVVPTCYGCRREKELGYPSYAWLHISTCPKFHYE